MTPPPQVGVDLQGQQFWKQGSTCLWHVRGSLAASCMCDPFTFAIQLAGAWASRWPTVLSAHPKPLVLIQCYPVS